MALINKKEMLDKISNLPETYQAKVEGYIERLYEELKHEELSKSEIEEIEKIKIEMNKGEFVRHEDIDWDAE